ncbi:MAG: AMP-binding protein [Bacteroidales bacterium]|nr:AMP-binding protein [Bacteroidales bacterium]
MEHYLALLQEATRKFWDKSALNTVGGESFTYSQMAVLIEKFHIFFDEAGLGKDAHVALWARNSARWGMSYLSINTYEAVVVPILADFTPENVEFLIGHSDSVALLTNADKFSKLDMAKCPGIRFAMDVDNLEVLYSTDPKIEQAWKSIDSLFAARHPQGFGPGDVSYPTDNMDELAVINYTSGSTGNPKGVMLTYRNFSATIDFSQRNRPTSAGNRMISMLPMAHMYGLVTEFIYPLCFGTSIYWLGKAPTPSTLMKAFQEVRPYQLITVPLVMEKIFKSKVKPMLDKPALKFLCAIPGVRNLVFRKVRQGLIDAFGGEASEFILGGAPVSPEVEKWFKKIKFPYTVGYGMTEATPLLAYASCATYVAGSCGRPVDCCTVRIDSEDPEHIAGEIQAKGDNICIGYYKNPEASANAFTDDGFLKTGDLGIMDKDGNVFIKGRSKSMILTANGQNVYPEEVEAIINDQPFVAESLVVDRASHIVALVYFDQDAVRKEGLDAEAIADLPEKVRTSANRRLASYSQIAKVEVQEVPFEKTPKMSIKRFLYK